MIAAAELAKAAVKADLPRGTNNAGVSVGGALEAGLGRLKRN